MADISDQAISEKETQVGKSLSIVPTPGWQLIQAFYLLLLGVSAVGFLAPPLHTREGRWGIGLALANFTLAVLGTAVTRYAYRRGEPWSWWTVLATGLCYGVPMTLIDYLTVGWMGFVSQLELLLIILWVAGLIRGSKLIFATPEIDDI